jgi:hypothetical protein
VISDKYEEIETVELLLKCLETDERKSGEFKLKFHSMCIQEVTEKSVTIKLF